MYTCLGPGAVGIDRPFPETAELAATHGFDGVQVELGYLNERGPERCTELLSEYGLRPGSFGLPVDLEAEDPQYDRDLDRLREVAPAVAAVGCSRCSTYIPSFSDERPFEENFAFYRSRLEPVAEILAGHGIDLGLEFLGPRTLREGHEYEFVHDIDGMLELCSAVDPDTVGLLLDSWHWYTSGGSVEALHRLDAGDIVDVHVNDAPDGVPREQQVDSVRRLPGTTGVIDIETFLGHLDAVGYDGPVMVEPFSDELAEMDPGAAAERTAQSLEAVWDAAGL